MARPGHKRAFSLVLPRTSARNLAGFVSKQLEVGRGRHVHEVGQGLQPKLERWLGSSHDDLRDAFVSDFLGRFGKRNGGWRRPRIGTGLWCAGGSGVFHEHRQALGRIRGLADAQAVLEDELRRSVRAARDDGTRHQATGSRDARRASAEMARPLTPGARVAHIGFGIGGRMDEEETRSHEVLVEQALAVRRRVYELRGELVSMVNEVESWVDVVICQYFFGNAAQAQFRSWVLSRLALASKVEVLGVIVREMGVATELAPVLQSLRAANEIRVLHAHSYVDADAGGLVDGQMDLERVLQWQVVRQGKGGQTSVPADVTAMEGELAVVRDAAQAVFTIWGVVGTFKSGGDVARAVGEALALQVHSVHKEEGIS